MESPHEGIGKYYAAVQGFVSRLVRQQALAEDLTQETFLRVERSSSAHRGEASKRTWLFAIALNVVRDHFRAAARTPAPDPDPEATDRLSADENTEQQVQQAEMSACIAEFLFQLPHPQCDVVALHDEAGLSHGEIAASLGLSVSNSRVLLHRGRAALREKLKENCVLSFDDAVPCERRAPKAR
jgi:RNA polymerase sigma-70 factor (ECF subfamily)